MSVGSTLVSKFKLRHMRYPRGVFSPKGAFGPRGNYPRNRRRHIIANIEHSVADIFSTGTVQVVTFDNVTNTVLLTSHGFVAGDGPFTFNNSGGSIPTGLVRFVHHYWITPTSDNAFTISRDRVSAARGTGITPFTDDGSGTSTIEPLKFTEGAFVLMRQGLHPDTYAAETDLDNLIP